jgi:hypothetical protein
MRCARASHKSTSVSLKGNGIHMSSGSELDYGILKVTDRGWPRSCVPPARIATDPHNHRRVRSRVVE